jgi:hypothetical protein
MRAAALFLVLVGNTNAYYDGASDYFGGGDYDDDAMWMDDDFGYYGSGSNNTTKCVPNCPSTWIGDGMCDRQCYVEECQMDGGDCEGKDMSEGGYGDYYFPGAGNSSQFDWGDFFDNALGGE